MPFDPATLPKPFDAGQAERGLERWRDSAAASATAPDLRDWALTFADSAPGRALLDAVCGNSPYLGQILGRELAVVRRIDQEGFDAPFADLMKETRAALAGERSTDGLMTGLRQTKRRAALLIALADIAGAWPLERVTAALSEVAETAVRLACAHLLRRAADTGTLTLPDPQRPWVGSGLIVLAMGKLGARELNYSSDIDLIVLYDDEVVRTPQPDSMARTFIRIARDLVRIMEERTKDGYVFRTDLRLRPDPGAMPLAVSVSTAEVYYGSVGQNWERAAMIKARAIAGDDEAARSFLDGLKPFIWRRHLDFAAIQDIHSIKRQINAHKGHRAVTVNGHDIKVGRGGIREIEFFAQTQQLIFGGRESALRIRPTCEALGALCQAGRVQPGVLDELTAAYRFLRQVEHRIQMIDDRQTHQIPAGDAGVAHLATFLGYDDVASFRAGLLAQLGRVEDRYAELFEESAPLSGPGNLVFTGTDDDPDTVATVTGMGYRDASRLIAVVSAWHRGRYRATRTTRARQLLTELVPALLSALAGTPQPDVALMNFDAFLGRLPAGVPLFSLFCANPWLLELVAEIMGTAPRLAETLSRNPSLLDAVLANDFFNALPDRATLDAGFRHVVGQARDFEDALTLARRWTNDQRFRAGVQILRGITDGDRCGPFLADLADVVVSELGRRVQDEFARRHGRIAGSAWVVVAMGKLGSRQLTITSDIDLIVVYDTPAGSGTPVSDGERPLAPSEYYTRLTQRLVNAVTAPMADGRLYEVDMRLRPSGNSGPLATSLDAFVKYQAHDAWTWEQMALTRARVLGEGCLAGRVGAAIATAVTRPRDPAGLLHDVADMRRRIDKEFGTDNPWVLKYARGGLIDIEFIAQYLQLRHAHDHPQVVSANTATALANLAAAGLLDAAMAAELVGTLRLWRRVQGFLRLTVSEALDAAHVPADLLAGLSRAAFPDEPPAVDFATLDARIRAVAATAWGHFRTLVDEPAAVLSQERTPS
jgi:glutamate-ammonia-ligase adenylyltransferase